MCQASTVRRPLFAAVIRMLTSSHTMQDILQCNAAWVARGDVCVVVEGLVRTRGAHSDGGYPVSGRGIYVFHLHVCVHRLSRPVWVRKHTTLQPGASRCTGAVPIIPSERAAAIAALNPKPDWEAWMPSEAQRIGSAVASE